MPEITERFTVIINGARFPLDLGVDIDQFKLSIVTTALNGGGFVDIPSGNRNVSVFASAGVGILIERMHRDTATAD